MFFPLFIEIGQKISNHIENFKVKSKIIYGVWQRFIYCILNLCFLPFVAFDNLMAVIVTLYRMTVNKNLLCWVTAQQGEQKSSSDILIYVRKMWISIVSAALILTININSFTLIISVVFFLAPFLAFYIGQPKKRESQLSKEQVQNLLLYSKKCGIILITW
jgi:hypothetical protein